ncbi:cytochrome P450 [Streptomyces sp. NPDC088747]|uniref:cytochrome P450 n=1 Tax=Streptomyces sp. NPDC088747 TaxID=3365886 RepID=UPI00381057D1
MHADAQDQGRCPFAHGSEEVVDQLDPFGAPYLADPYAVFARARAEGRVFHSEELGHWILTRHEDIKAVLRDTKRYSADIANQPLVPFSDEVRKQLADLGFRPRRVLVDNDPPNHLRIRRHVNKAFNARRLRLLEPDIRELAEQHIDTFADQDEIDFVAALAWPLPALVIFRLFGVPADRLEIIKDGSRDRVTLTDARPTPDEQRRAAQGLGAFFAYCREIVADRTENLADDFPSDLIRSGQGDETAPDFDELVTIMYSILFAGHETTTGFLTHLLRRCLAQPDLWQRLRENRELVPAMVEEVLRLDPPVINWRRRAKEEVTIGGTVIPADASLLLLLGSANHDESVYDHPDEVDLGREAAQPHLSFGAGPHMCLGAPLARLEGQLVLEALLDRFPRLSLPEQELRFRANLRFRSPERLLVQLHQGG